MNIPTDDLKNARKIGEKWYAERIEKAPQRNSINLLKRNKQKTS